MSLSPEVNHPSQHMLAAIHHEQAASFHLAACRHFESGKDFAHSSHQAMLAHGHSLKALDYGRSAMGFSRLRLSEDPQPARLLASLLEANLSDSKGINSAADHHREAANHSVAAAAHERRASSLEIRSDLVQAAKEAALADKHGTRSLFHSDEAAKYLSV